MVVFRAQIIQAQSDMQSSSQKFAHSSSISSYVLKIQKVRFETVVDINLHLNYYKENQNSVSISISLKMSFVILVIV